MKALCITIVGLVLLSASVAEANVCGGDPGEYDGETTDVPIEITVEASDYAKDGNPSTTVVLYLPRDQTKGGVGGILIEPWQMIMFAVMLSLAVMLLPSWRTKRVRLGRVKQAAAAAASVGAIAVLLAASCAGSGKPAATAVTATAANGQKLNATLHIVTTDDGKAQLVIPAAIRDKL